MTTPFTQYQPRLTKGGQRKLKRLREVHETRPREARLQAINILVMEEDFAPLQVVEYLKEWEIPDAWTSSEEVS